MKTLLITLNSKFPHTSPAIRSLAKFGLHPGEERQALEYTVNQPREQIVMDIAARGGDVLAFSVYIFNLTQTLEVIRDLALLFPETPILCGGPEVSYDCEAFLRANRQVWAVQRGEGEISFSRIMELALKHGPARLKEALTEQKLKGVALLEGEEYRDYGEGETLCDLTRLPFPYTPEELQTPHRIFYYESARGCPYGCAYCLSSVQGGVRAKPEDTVKAEWKRFLDAKSETVKCTDRTFNFDRDRARRLLEFLKENDNGVTTFHFEIAAWLLDDETVALCRTLRPGQVQFEIGVQSTYPPALKAIRRPGRTEEIALRVRQLAGGPATLHLDLIAGLPEEGYERFGRSLCEVLDWGGDCVQLGFLKILKGTDPALWAKYGFRYSENPPYEILYNHALSYPELCRLKEIEQILEWYYNSGLCRRTLSFLVKQSDAPFRLLETLAEALRQRGMFTAGQKPRTLAEALRRFLEETDPPGPWRALLSMDWYAVGFLDPLPGQLPPDRGLTGRALSHSEALAALLPPDKRGTFLALSRKQWLRHAAAVAFPCDETGRPLPCRILFLTGPLRAALPLAPGGPWD